MTLPPTEIWSLFPALAVIVLVMAVMLFALWKIWGEFNKWIDKQNIERNTEKDRQRAWEAEQDKTRDDRWQSFIREERTQRERESQADRAQLAHMTEMIAQLSTNTQSMAEAVGQLTSAFHDHVTEDAARFDVLLDDQQKAAIDVKTQPRKRGKP